MSSAITSYKDRFEAAQRRTRALATRNKEETKQAMTLAIVSTLMGAYGYAEMNGNIKQHVKVGETQVPVKALAAGAALGLAFFTRGSMRTAALEAGKALSAVAAYQEGRILAGTK